MVIRRARFWTERRSHSLWSQLGGRGKGQARSGVKGIAEELCAIYRLRLVLYRLSRGTISVKNAEFSALKAHFIELISNLGI